MSGFFIPPPVPKPPPEDEPPPGEPLERVMVTVNGFDEVSPLVLLFSSTVTIFDSINEIVLSTLPLYE